MKLRADPSDSVAVWRHTRAVLLLPAMNTLVIPALIVASFGGPLSQRPAAAVDWLAIAVGLGLLVAGAAIVLASIRAFVKRGRGTLAPWDPPRALLVDGPYRHCRNPMKAGLFMLLAGEAALLQSLPLLVWLLLFAVVNVVYIRVSEEPGLRQRFGAVYMDYCRAVPRWLPRLPSARRRGAEAS